MKLVVIGRVMANGRSWLTTKEVPYALTLVLGALGWCTVHLVDEVQTSPTLAYCKSTIVGKDGSKTVTFRVTNISRKQLFRQVSFYVSAVDGNVEWESFVSPLIKAEPPAKVVADDNIPPKAEQNVIRYYVGQFQPDSSWNFSAVFPPKKEQDVVLEADFSAAGPGITAVEPMALRLVRAGPETFLVQHQVGFLLSLIVIWIALAILYLIKIKIPQT